MDDKTAGPNENSATSAIDRHVGGQMQRQRLGQGLSATIVAQALNVAEPTLDQWERGQLRVPAHHLLSLSRLFFCPLAAFFEGLPNSATLGDTDALDNDITSVINNQFDAKH